MFYIHLSIWLRFVHSHIERKKPEISHFLLILLYYITGIESSKFLIWLLAAAVLGVCVFTTMNQREDDGIHTTSFSGLIQLLSGNWTSNLMYRSPFSKGFRYCGMPSPRTTLTEPGKKRSVLKVYSQRADMKCQILPVQSYSRSKLYYSWFQHFPRCIVLCLQAWNPTKEACGCRYSGQIYSYRRLSYNKMVLLKGTAFVNLHRFRRWTTYLLDL